MRLSIVARPTRCRLRGRTRGAADSTSTPGAARAGWCRIERCGGNRDGGHVTRPRAASMGHDKNRAYNKQDASCRVTMRCNGLRTTALSTRLSATGVMCGFAREGTETDDGERPAEQTEISRTCRAGRKRPRQRPEKAADQQCAGGAGVFFASTDAWPAADDVTVAKVDSLSKIAKKLYGNGDRWRESFRGDIAIQIDNPDLISRVRFSSFTADAGSKD